MADQKLRELTETTTPVSTDLVYTVVDPGGTPLDRKLEIGSLLGNDGAWVNLIKNSPGQIYTVAKDGAEPEWWDDSASATGTDEDAIGEGIPDRTARVFKVVTTGNDEYTYQIFTFADESLLDAGVTKVSLSAWVYCASANKASIGIYGTNLGLQESSQHTGDSTWQLLTIENITLDAADASIQVRLIVDTGTAYFTMPMLNTGSKSLPWVPRRIDYFNSASLQTVVTGTSGDTAWTNADCTATTHPLAVGVSVRIYATEAAGTVGSSIQVCHGRNLTSGDYGVAVANIAVLGVSAYSSYDYLCCDDGQNIRYTIAESDADNDVTWGIYATGHWRWVP